MPQQVGALRTPRRNRGVLVQQLVAACWPSRTAIRFRILSRHRDRPSNGGREVHTRLLRCALEVEDSRGCWQRVPVDGKHAIAQRAFNEFWFGARSLARVDVLLANFRTRFDAYPKALRISGLDRHGPGTRRLICHWHLQLADPLYRSFTGAYLPERTGGRAGCHARPRRRMGGRTGRAAWTMATRIQFASKLLSAAFAAGLVASNRDPRPLSIRASPTRRSYLMYLLREVDFAGTLLENPYLASVGLARPSSKSGCAGSPHSASAARATSSTSAGATPASANGPRLMLSRARRSTRVDAMNQPLFTTPRCRRLSPRSPATSSTRTGPASARCATTASPSCSTTRADEFELRGEVQRLSAELVANGWIVLSINLQKLLLDRVRAQGADWVERVIAMERTTASLERATRPELPEVEAHAAHRGAGRHRRRLQPRHLRVRRPAPRPRRSHARAHRPRGRALSVLPVLGAAPASRRQNAQRAGGPALSGRAARPDGPSFMGMLDPDNDYRPRIYP